MTRNLLRQTVCSTDQACPKSAARMTRKKGKASIRPRLPHGRPVAFKHASPSPPRKHSKHPFYFLDSSPSMVFHQAQEMFPVLDHVHTFCIAALGLPHFFRHDFGPIYTTSSKSFFCSAKTSSSSQICLHSLRLSARSTVTTLSDFILFFSLSLFLLTDLLPFLGLHRTFAVRSFGHL